MIPGFPRDSEDDGRQVARVRILPEVYGSSLAPRPPSRSIRAIWGAERSGESTAGTQTKHIEPGLAG